jgi:tetratricopeptide (TPR) repeat protein
VQRLARCLRCSRQVAQVELIAGDEASQTPTMMRHEHERMLSRRHLLMGLYPAPRLSEFCFEYAALRLLSGDRPGYAKVCAPMVEWCGKASDLRAYHVARACTLAHDAVAEATRPARLAEQELQAAARQFWSLTEQGALAYRAGRHQEAVPLFEQSLKADTRLGRAVLNWLWLALAHQRLGKPEEARRWLRKAQVWLDLFKEGMPARAEEELGLHLHNWLEAHVLRREAEELIRSAQPRSDTANRERGPSQK